jgi:DNA-binding Xre family transcriptional regulator
MSKVTKLKQLLIDRGMKQSDLVNKINDVALSPLPQYQISKICTGKLTNYSVHTLIKICRALDVTPSEVLDKQDYLHLFEESE